MMTARCIFYASLLLAPWQWEHTPRQPALQGTRTKRALIIAVGAYRPQATGWQPLSARNDVPLVRDALARHGFAAANVAVLTDGDCTKAGIVTAIERYLIAAAQPGDVVFLHFTGHGQQIVDDNDEETDGMDEALIPIDAPYNYRKKGYSGENHLRDDEFGRLLDRMRRKVGAAGEVIFTIDACHSGSVTRGEAQEGEDAETSGYIEMPVLPDAQAALAPFVVFSSSSYDQPTSETIDPALRRAVGPLSYAFSKSFAALGPKATYRSLFAEIKNIMATKVPKQTPQVEGDLDRPVLGIPRAE
jgi:hypothetical protein